MEAFDGGRGDEFALAEVFESFGTGCRRGEVLGILLAQAVEKVQLAESALDDCNCQ